MSLGAPSAVGANATVLANGEKVAPVGNYKVKTATNVRPRRFVKKDTTDKEIQVTTTGNVPLGMIQHRIKDGELDTTADFVAADVVKVIRGPGAIVAVVLQNGSSAVAPGDPLTTGTTGTLKKAAAVSATVPGSGTTVTSSSAQPAMTMAGGVLPEPIVAYAMETADPSSAEVACAAMLAF